VNPNGPRALWAGLLAIICASLARTADAYPNLQLYSPQAVYVNEHDDPWFEETWFVPTKEFELWLVAWREDADILDVRITIAVPEDEFEQPDSWVKLQWLDGSPIGDYYADYPPGAEYSNYVPPPVNIPLPGTLQLDFDDSSDEHYLNGTPIMGDPDAEPPKYLPFHGVFPTWFAEAWLGTLPTKSEPRDDIWNSVGDDGEGVPWVPPDEDGDYPYDTAPGVIYKLWVEVEGFTKVHFDAHDGLYNANGKHYKTVFCPFSHDLATPEPASLFFFGAVVPGVLAAVSGRRRRRGRT